MPAMSNQQRHDFIMDIYNVLFAPEINIHDANIQTILGSKRIPQKWAPWIVGLPKFRCFKNSTTGQFNIPGIDIDLDITAGQPSTQNMQVLNLRFIAQNPDKMKGGALSQTAVLARRGIRIMWVLDRNVRGWGGLCKVQDGVAEPCNQSAYQRVAATANDQYGSPYEQSNGEWNRQVEELPTVSAMGVPDHVIQSLG